jgi:hypothetical protein
MLHGFFECRCCIARPNHKLEQPRHDHQRRSTQTRVKITKRVENVLITSNIRASSVNTATVVLTLISHATTACRRRRIPTSVLNEIAKRRRVLHALAIPIVNIALWRGRVKLKARHVSLALLQIRSFAMLHFRQLLPQQRRRFNVKTLVVVTRVSTRNAILRFVANSVLPSVNEMAPDAPVPTNLTFVPITLVCRRTHDLFFVLSLVDILCVYYCSFATGTPSPPTPLVSSVAH